MPATPTLLAPLQSCFFATGGRLQALRATRIARILCGSALEMRLFRATILERGIWPLTVMA